MFVGSFIASSLKDYLSEKKAMERLRKSIIKKSQLISETDQRLLNSREARIQKVYKFALETHGGDLLSAKLKLSDETFRFAQKIQQVVEMIARYLKEKELQGIAKFIFKNGRLVLELLLYKCNIKLTYLPNPGPDTQVVIFTTIIGAGTGFSMAWFSVGGALVASPTLLSIFATRSLFQQIINHKEYQRFKEFMLEYGKEHKFQDILKVFVDFGNSNSNTSPAGVEKINNDRLLPRNLSSVEGFDTLRELKFKDTRMIVQVGKNGNPDQIVAICMRDDLENVLKKFKTKYN
jgi:hypothetical protein